MGGNYKASHLRNTTWQGHGDVPSSRMLKKSASIKGPLFGLSGLFSLSGCWLNEPNQINKTNQINQITRQTGLSQTCRPSKFCCAKCRAVLEDAYDRKVIRVAQGTEEPVGCS